MRSFKNTYYDIKQGHNHTLKFLNSSIAFIDAISVQKRLDNKGEHAYDDFLTEWEHSYIHDLKIPKRKMDFLCGRLAGKRAVRRHLVKNSHSSMNAGTDHPPFKDIEIRKTVTGRPVVFVKDGSSKNGTSDYYVSISHTEGVAASLVSNKMDCKGIGIDIEKIEERDKSLFNVAFTDLEIEKLKHRIFNQNGKSNRLLDEEIARYWSIKEAVMKSMGVGVNIDLKNIEVKNTDGYSAVVNLKNDAHDRYILLKGTDLKVESTKIENFMISIACLY
ncbi:MAG: 4'-phosphopantetheinyl transferase superfamily protein [Spirochaetes bacterium]|nr:4'-phosphopantetheinyl transferase superfamily protein [Spirochaetota bacterium]